MKKKKPELFSNLRFRNLVEEYVQGETTRKLLIRFYVDDLTLEELEEEFHLSVSQIKRYLYKNGQKIFKMMENEP